MDGCPFLFESFFVGFLRCCCCWGTELFVVVIFVGPCGDATAVEALLLFGNDEDTLSADSLSRQAGKQEMKENGKKLDDDKFPFLSLVLLLFSSR